MQGLVTGRHDLNLIAALPARRAGAEKIAVEYLGLEEVEPARRTDIAKRLMERAAGSSRTRRATPSSAS